MIKLLVLLVQDICELRCGQITASLSIACTSCQLSLFAFNELFLSVCRCCPYYVFNYHFNDSNIRGSWGSIVEIKHATTAVWVHAAMLSSVRPVAVIIRLSSSNNRPLPVGLQGGGCPQTEVEANRAISAVLAPGD